MTFDDYKQIRWLTIYGAMIAHQVIDRQNRGLSPPDEEIMERFAEEAEAVADLHDETERRLPRIARFLVSNP
jgi:hypothetical protein